MSMRPGGRQFGQFSLEDGALVNSLALTIEEEFAAVYQGVKNAPLPPTARKDMRLLFVGVARGVLRYLHEQEAGNIIAKMGPGAHQHQVDFDVDMS
jgi:hypothetical protein